MNTVQCTNKLIKNKLGPGWLWVEKKGDRRQKKGRQETGDRETGDRRREEGKQGDKERGDRKTGRWEPADVVRGATRSRDVKTHSRSLFQFSPKRCKPKIPKLLHTFIMIFEGF